jgi:hypothetical protein
VNSATSFHFNITSKHFIKPSLYKETMEDWSERKAKLKETFSRLIESDVLTMEGKDRELLDRLEKRLGKTREAIIKLISDL